jgi:hypothetical protein
MQHRGTLTIKREPLCVRWTAAEKEADKRRRRLRRGVMPVVYVEMMPGEIPVYTYARGRHAYVYVPKKGWVRQEAPGKPDEVTDPLGIRALNAYVPLVEVSKNAFVATMKRRVRTLPRTQRTGVLVVHFHFSGDYVHFGLTHTQVWTLTEPGYLEPTNPPWPWFPRGMRRTGEVE